MAKIEIIRRDGKVEFHPSPLEASAGDNVFWSNLDPLAQHWITLKGKSEDFWFPVRLAPFVDGQPADTCSEISLRKGPPVIYVCSLHPGEEGEITVASPDV